MTRIGNHTLTKTAPATFVLTDETGAIVGTYPTAKKASDAAIARITAAYKAKARA